MLTDGNDINVDEVTQSIEGNNIPADICQAVTLRWGKLNWPVGMEGYFDIVIAADVVYESSIFTSLLETLAYVLKPEGQFILFNPTRDGVLQKFVKLAQKSSDAFTDVTLTEHYESIVSDILWELKSKNQAFNKEWHYPYQVTFKKVANFQVSEDTTF